MWAFFREVESKEKGEEEAAKLSSFIHGSDHLTPPFLKDE